MGPCMVHLLDDTVTPPPSMKSIKNRASGLDGIAFPAST